MCRGGVWSARMPEPQGERLRMAWGPEPAVSLTSRDLCPFATDITFLQSKVSQLWALSVVHTLMLLPPACDLGQLTLKVPSFSLYHSTRSVRHSASSANHLPSVWPGICLVMGGLSQTATPLGRVSLGPGATNCLQTPLCYKEKPPACGSGSAAELKTHSVLQAHCGPEAVLGGWRERARLPSAASPGAWTRAAAGGTRKERTGSSSPPWASL